MLAPTLGADIEGEGTGSADRADGGEADAKETPEFVAAHLLPCPRHLAEESEPRQRMKIASVDVAEIDPLRADVAKQLDRPLDVGRHSEIGGKQVHRTERQHAKRLVCPCKRMRGAADGPVAAAHDESGDVALRGTLDFVLQVGRPDQPNLHLLAPPLQRGCERLAHTLRAGVDQGASACVQQDQGFSHIEFRLG